jgi:hypothetical protein
MGGESITNPAQHEGAVRCTITALATAARSAIGEYYMERP